MSNQPPSFYSIFSGIVISEGQSLSTKTDVARPWMDRLSGSDILKNHLIRNYYQNYLRNIAPEIMNEAGVRHLTMSSFLENPVSFTIPEGRSVPLKLIVPYFDVFFFPGNVCVFAFKVLTPEENSSYEACSSIINYVRNPNSILLRGETQMTVSEFIYENLSPLVDLSDSWFGFSPQLKSYTVINDNSVTSFDDDLDQKLFELSHILPIGARHQPLMAPSPTYYAEVLSNSISIYNNWKAIPLFDTFTRISCSFPDEHNAWEYEYFLIYVHGLYTKFKLYSFNSQLQDVSVISKQTTIIRDNFVEFVNDYHLANISYKFLPNELYKAINESLGIHDELVRMEQKVQRINEAYQERKSKQMNLILLAISFLSVLSVVADLSNWLAAAGLSKQLAYSPLTPVFAGLVIAFLALFALRR